VAKPQNVDDLVDPLVEQISGVMRLSARPSATRRQQVRRFSDADRATTAGPSSKPEPISVRSRDGSRWLPTPDEVTHTVGRKGSLLVAPVSEKETATEPCPSQPHTCSSAICAITKLFETTELLELVLGFLEARDVLALRRTNTRWNSTVQASPQLRLHFFVYPEFTRPGAEFKLLPLTIPGLSIEPGQPLHLGRWINITMTADAATRIIPTPRPTKRVRSRSIFEGLRGGLGPKVLHADDPWPATRPTVAVEDHWQHDQLFVTQPPIVNVQAFVVSSAPDPSDDREKADVDDPGPPACAKLSCDAGITLGFLAETAQSLLATTKNAGDDAHVVFKTIMSFCTSEKAPRKRGLARSVTMIG